MQQLPTGIESSSTTHRWDQTTDVAHSNRRDARKRRSGRLESRPPRL